MERGDPAWHTWTYGCEPAQGYDSDADMSNLDPKFRDCEVTPLPTWSVVTKQSSLGVPIGGGGELAAMNVSLYAGIVHMGAIPLPTNSTSYVVTKTYTTNIVTPYTGSFESGQSVGAYQCTITIQRNPVLLEAVILPDPPPALSLPNYADWVPSAGPDEDTVGSNFLVRVILRPKGSQDLEARPSAQARFIFHLNKVSREPGICLNYPPKDHAKTTPDLKIHPTSNLTVFDDGSSAQTLKGDLSEAGVTVGSFDFGAYKTS